MNEMETRYRSDSERLRGEGEDSKIYYKIVAQMSPHHNADPTPKIRLFGERYSIKWILYYSEARRAGISCMQTCRTYAFRMGGEVEFHEVDSRNKDMRLLWVADRYMSQHGLYRKPKRKRRDYVAA